MVLEPGVLVGTPFMAAAAVAVLPTVVLAELEGYPPMVEVVVLVLLTPTHLLMARNPEVAVAAPKAATAVLVALASALSMCIDL
jgi:phosphatidylserine synthase